MNDPKTQWDTSYEWKAVALLGLGFGLVGLDRWIIAPLFPFIVADLGLADGDVGRLAIRSRITATIPGSSRRRPRSTRTTSRSWPTSPRRCKPRPRATARCSTRVC